MQEAEIINDGLQNAITGTGGAVDPRAAYAFRNPLQLSDEEVDHGDGDGGLEAAAQFVRPLHANEAFAVFVLQLACGGAISGVHRQAFAAALERLDEFRLVGFAVAIAVGDFPDAALVPALVDGNPQDAVVPEQAVCAVELDAGGCDGGLRVFRSGGRDLIDRAMLVGEDDPLPPTFVDSPACWLDPETVDPDQLLGLQQAAAAQVMLLDEFLGVILDLMEREPIWESTLFCLVSPRGCALGEHGLVGPGAQLFNESVHVPLLIRPPTTNNRWQAARTGRLTQVHTLSELVQEWLLRSDCFAERLTNAARIRPDKLTEVVLIVSNEHESIQTHAWKLIRSKMGGVQLFAKPDDRYEVNDVSNLCPDIIRKLMVVMDYLLERRGTQAETTVNLSSDLALGIT